ncbi:MAG: patatin-like protein, partial [Acidimicrobiia bacterium]
MTTTDSNQQNAAKRVGPDTLDVRFAATMTGGVSLAIWMGGVARELNLLEQASFDREHLAADQPLPPTDAATAPDGAHPSRAEQSRALYLRLLELLDLTVNTDVLSGTSAGGINAALLGFTRSNGLDLGILRNVWLETGSFERLLRDPDEKSPPSLLQGDAVLLDGLNTGITKLADEVTNGPVDGQHTTVFITTTLLAGETSRFTDDFGTLVQDVEHRGLFRFGENDLRDEDNQPAFALAARCSASYPAAFEPAFVPFATDVDKFHPAMGRFSNITRDQFVADGGVLMNKPIRPLIDEVFTRTADRQVRRVLLYVVPLTGDAPDAKATPPADEFKKPPTFAGALAKDLGALMNQSISAELRAIRQHN